MIDRHVVKASWSDWWSFALQPRGPHALQWLWTLLFCVAVAAGLTLAFATVFGAGAPSFLWPFFRDNLILSLTIGLLIQALSDLAIGFVGVARLRRLAPGGLIVFWCTLALLGGLIGWPLGMTLAGRDLLAFGQAHPRALRASIIFSALLTLAIFVWIAAVTRRAEAERRAGEAQMRLLQGQMEPHFLFNTLANVLTLMDTDTPRARQMLEAFIDYLRASLGQMRHERHTVAHELALVRSYLELVQMRMGERLRFEIDVPAAAERSLLPPLLLQPLVENAIRHGLEPKIEGGEVRIHAAVDGGRLRLCVRDDGLGLGAIDTPGTGLALKNVRERLASRYGRDASFELQPLVPGALAILDLPYQAAAPATP
jgi:two-component sensor histidine kinase